MTFQTTTTTPSPRRRLRTAVLALTVVCAGLALFGTDAALGPARSASACVNHRPGDGCRGPQLNTTQAEEEESNRMSSGRPNRTRRRTASPAQREAEREAARRAACESDCGAETADMLNRSLNDPDRARIADAYGRACMRACGSDSAE